MGLRTSVDHVPLITGRDVVLVFYLCAMAVVAWTLPERFLTGVSRAIARTTTNLRPAKARRTAELVAGLWGDEPPLRSPAAVVSDIAANVHLGNLYHLRVLRPGGWRPIVRLEGQSRIDEAIAGGRGAVLWVAPLLFSDLVTKIALDRAGYRISHLSLFTHGFSPSRFGVRFLNRFATRAEDRFVRDRLVITPDHPFEPIRELVRRVRHCEVVSMSAIAADGQRTVTVPFFRRSMTVAAGAPELARRTGAELLWVFTVRLDDGSFRTVVEKPAGGAGSRDVATSVEAYARRFERYVSRWPEQYAVYARRLESDARQL